MVRRDTGKHFTVTNSTKVCSLHFKNEHLRTSLGVGRLSYVDGVVPSVFAWKRSSPRKRPPARPRDTSSSSQKKSTAQTSLDMSAVPGSCSESISTDVSDSVKGV